MDHRPGQCISGPAKRRNGCSSAHAQEGTGQRSVTVNRATESAGANRREQAGDSDRTGKSTGCLCAFLRPGLRVGGTILSIPVNLLSALLRVVVCGRGDLLG